MKKSLLIALLVPVMASAQRDTLPASYGKQLIIDTMPLPGALIGSLNFDSVSYFLHRTDKYFVQLNPRDSTIKIEGDTVLALKEAMFFYFQAANDHRKERETMWAAEGILALIRTDGTIRDRKAFNEAVKEYRKLKSQ